MSNVKRKVQVLVPEDVFGHVAQSSPDHIIFTTDSHKNDFDFIIKKNYGPVVTEKQQNPPKLLLWGDSLANVTANHSVEQLMSFDAICGPHANYKNLYKVIDILADQNTSNETDTLKVWTIEESDKTPKDRHKILEKIYAETKNSKYHRHIWNICEELIMNDMKHLRDKKNNKLTTIKIQESDAYIEIECEDHEGIFRKQKFFDYLSKMQNVGTNALKIDTKEGGAGLGLIKTLHHCHGLSIKVVPMQNTKIRYFIQKNTPLKSPAQCTKVISFI